MQNLKIHNSKFITYKDSILIIDILGGVDLQQVERMICTLRITHGKYAPYRTTLDLYNDNQIDKLLRTLCDKWELKLSDVSKTIHKLILQLEQYRFEQLKYTGKGSKTTFEISEEDKAEAIKLLKSKTLLKQLTTKLNATGIIGEDENATILFMALASYKFSNPFSVLCLAKSGIGKSYILQKLSECMPTGSYSFHTQISANALYYFNSYEIQNKALLIEDLEWTTEMLQPLATLQTQGRLVKTRATKNKDGMIHSTTFEVTGNLCLLACAYSDKNYESMSLPFLMVHLNHSHSQDIAIMQYQKKLKANLIQIDEVQKAQSQLKNILATLQNISIINTYATLIDLPEDVAHPRKSLLLLLNFIEVITYFHQYQREQITDQTTGEIFIKTHPNDIELAFKLLKNSLFRRADELSTSARGFYKWLSNFLEDVQTERFTALDIRKAKAIHPRTLNRYLQELKLYSYVQVIGGNKHRGGFLYKLTQFGNQTDVQNRIENDLKKTLEKIYKSHNESSTTQEEKQPIEQPTEQTEKETTSQQEPQKITRIRIAEKEKHTLKLLLELEEQEPNREYLPSDFVAITGRSIITESRHMKTLCDQGKLKRVWKNKRYRYTLVNSGTVSQKAVSNSQTQQS